MDKKKVQDFISKLQEMATQLNEPDQEAETGVEASAAVEESQNVENHAVHASVDTVSVKSHSIGNVSDYARPGSLCRQIRVQSDHLRKSKNGRSRIQTL